MPDSMLGLPGDVLPAPPPRRHRPGVKHISLALQGGGSHGAFTWGVMHRLISDPRLYIDGISGDWASWGPNFTSAAARIYNDPATGWHLTVTAGPQHTGVQTTASATCLSLKN